MSLAGVCRSGAVGAAAVLVTSLLGAPSASASTHHRGKHGPAPPSRSIGAPNAGALQGGVELEPSRHVRLLPGAHAWAVPPLVDLLRRAAVTVAKRHAGSRLLVGDLSARGGGPLSGHAGHQSGRDADLGFFVRNSRGKAVEVRRFVAFDAEGQGRNVAWARFDDARNWALVEALLGDEVPVEHVFVDAKIRARLLAFAEKHRVRDDVLARAETVLASPAGADLGDDRFRVRIACPKGSSKCVEEARPLQPGAPTGG